MVDGSPMRAGTGTGATFLRALSYALDAVRLSLSSTVSVYVPSWVSEGGATNCTLPMSACTRWPPLAPAGPSDPTPLPSTTTSCPWAGSESTAVGYQPVGIIPRNSGAPR
jgi:hypothetical protein